MFSSHRIQLLNEHAYKKGSILYWTEWALRYEWNCALEYATRLAHEKNAPLLSLVTVDQDYAHENIRQLVFLIQSLTDLRETYKKNGLTLSILWGKTENILRDVCEKQPIGAIIVSASYIHYFRDILLWLADTLSIPVILIDDASLLPPWIASDHVEYGAYTLRKKYWKKIETLPLEMPEVFPVQSMTIGDDLDTISHSEWYRSALLNIHTLEYYPWGEWSAQKRWSEFASRLPLYDQERNNPNKDTTSRLSPYLHFGCISPLQIFHDLRDVSRDICASFLEECFVRRELAINMWYYEKKPDSWECLPAWVIKTLDSDSGRFQTSLLPTDNYTVEDLIEARTLDPLWNAAQRELITTGKIHWYVRMYWWKQLLRWFEDWREAYRIGIYLNDRFAIDGCSPNGYTGVAWCFWKHDRPFPPKKPHYGLVRSMTLGGMKKKFDTEAYIRHWS